VLAGNGARAAEIARIERSPRGDSTEPVPALPNQEFGLPLKITPDVLVPRPETETVVAAALAAIDRTGARSRAWR